MEDTDLAFSASHSDGLAAVAVTRGRAIGVDVERLRPIDDNLGIARSFFCTSEYVSLAALPEHERNDAFLALWTRKESVVKATGLGLAMPLDGFDVQAASQGMGRPQGPDGPLPYVFADVKLPAGFAGSVTTGGALVHPVVLMAEAA
jgi:4'-phosphopantetheinyl transferase